MGVQFDDGLQRWEVQIPGEDSVKAIKAENLVFVPYDEETALEWGEEEDENDKGEKEEEVEEDGDGLEIGAFVRIDGLKSSAHLNGMIGELMSFDVGSGRWQVNVLDDESGNIMAIKPDNLTLVEEDDEEEGAEGGDELVEQYTAFDANQVHALLIE